MKRLGSRSSHSLNRSYQKCIIRLLATISSQEALIIPSSNPGQRSTTSLSSQRDNDYPLRCCEQNVEGGSYVSPYHYTRGRWLRHDSLQRKACEISFDFEALGKKVIQLCPGATSIVKCEKIEGGFNRVFIFTCDNAKRAVAKLPTSEAGPARLVTNSEVATIKYIQSSSKVSIPKILDWSDDRSNTVGSEYIITEHASGINLHQKWLEMSVQQQIKCIRAICKNFKQVAAIEAPAYGSLYLADGPLHPSSTLPFTEDFVIGPHCGIKYWDCNVGEERRYDMVEPNRGPWPHLNAYCDGLIDTGISCLPSDEASLSQKPSFQGSPATHLRLLNTTRKVLQRLSEDPRVQEAAKPMLYHADLHKRNIFVSDDDPTVVTAIIDWQHSSIEPALAYVDNVPDFTMPTTGLGLDEERMKSQAEYCRQAYDVGIVAYVRKFHIARVLDANFSRPFRYCHRTWRDGAAAHKQDLIELSSRWSELGLAGSCPYELPPRDERLDHQKEYDRFVYADDLREQLIDQLGTDTEGWVPLDIWEETEQLHWECFCKILKGLHETGEWDDLVPN